MKSKKNQLIIVLLTFTTLVVAGQVSIRTKHFNIEKRIAIQGFDPIAYFKLNKAVKGNKQFAVLAERVTYYFATTENKELFLKDYKKYEPQYGGWCAYAMGNSGEKVEIDPATFKILNGKLYLFYHTVFNNTLPKWNADETNLKTKADRNWQKIIQE